MPPRDLTLRRVVVVDVLDISTGKHSGTAIEFAVPNRDLPRAVTAEAVLAWLARDLPAAKRTIATRQRAGLDASQRLLAVVKDLKADAGLSAWRTTRRMQDATEPTDREEAQRLDAAARAAREGK